MPGDAPLAKGARLTTQVSIAGRLLVHLPQDTHIGISQRIDDEAARERLRARIVALLPAEQPGGYILRPVGADASDEELAARRAAWVAPQPRYERGYGWMFGRHILQADEGCDFDFLETSFGAPVAEPDIY